MTDHETTFTVTITTPHGKRCIEQFEHYLRKVADEALKRWGIEIEIERETPDELPENGGFNE